MAGIQAAKQTAQLIPLCHTLPLGQVNIDIVASKDGAEVKCTAKTIAQTGVEMEALVGVTVALLTHLRHVQGSGQRHDHFRRAIV